MRFLGNFFRDLSIKYKIVSVVVVTSGAALAIMGASVVRYDVREYKRSLVSDLSVKADIIAANSTAALAFEDYESARQTLSGLVHEYNIVIAYLLSAEGLTFATYVRGDVDGQHRKPILRTAGYLFTDDVLAVRRPIRFDGDVLGHIYIEADLSGVTERVKNFAATVSAIAAVTMLAIFVLASRLQKLISSPLLGLAGVAREISRDRDYSVRARKQSSDEVGVLIDGFNEMLSQIETRDAELEQHRGKLQSEVQKQTAELWRVNRRLRDSEQRIRTIVEGTSASTGQEFFDALVRILARALDTRWVLVTMLRPGYRLQAVALWNGIEVERGAVFALPGSPCEMVLRDGMYQLNDGVAEEFPADVILEGWGVRGYTGVALKNSTGRNIGVLCAMHDQQLPESAKDASLLRIYGSRAAAEVERLRVEQELLRSESSTRAILDSAADGIISVSSQGTIETFNAVAEQIFGHSGQSLTGMRITQLASFSDDVKMQNRFERQPASVLAELVGKRIELSGHRRNGEPFPMNMAVSEVRIGDQIGYTAIVRDVTREHELDQMKSDFVSTVSHEIRTPLVAIISAAKILMKRGVNDIAVNTKFSGIIVDEGMRLNRLINDLLDLSKLDARKVEWEIVDLAPADIVERLVEVTRQRSEDAGVSLVVDVPLDLPRLRTDRDRLLQVLINLVDNAVKFTPKGGRVEVVACRDGGGFVRFDVKDTGVGIPPELQGAIFNRFKQIGSVMTDKPQGTGLGLAISKEIIESLGGRIGVSSTVGEGSDFFFTLPAAETVIAESVDTNIARKIQGDPLAPTVLVVDDDQNARDFLSFALRRLHLNIIQARNGEEALVLARQRRPAMITLDVMMPGVSGYDVLDALRDDPGCCETPVIILSVLTDRDSRDRALQRGASAYLPKPVDEKLVIATARRLLNDGARDVLVIDDNTESAEAVKSQLCAQGFSVVQTAYGRHGLDFAGRLQPEMIVLGLASSAGKSRELLEALRANERTGSIPVLFLAEDDDQSPVEYFDTAASSEPTARGHLQQLLRLIAEREIAALRLADMGRSEEARPFSAERLS